MKELFETSKNDQIEGLKHLLISYKERIDRLPIESNWKIVLFEKMSERVRKEIQELEEEN